ncbi:hypothetical protein GCM10022221_12990 [Actinocorallia aurea]
MKDGDRTLRVGNVAYSPRHGEISGSLLPVQTGYTDDGQLLLLLTGAWQLLTGRARPADPEAAPDELIAFWSDPAMDSVAPRAPAAEPGRTAPGLTAPGRSAPADGS